MQATKDQVTATAISFDPLNGEDFHGYMLTVELTSTKEINNTDAQIISVFGTIAIEIAAEETETPSEIFKRAVDAIFK